MGTLSLACIAPPHDQAGLSILAEHGSAVVHHTAASRELPARQTPPLEVEDVIHQALLGLTGRTGWTTRPTRSRNDSTRQYALDDARLSCKQQVGGFEPARQLLKP
jgi:hypothetical protein